MDDEKMVEKKLPEEIAESSESLIDANNSLLSKNSTTENEKGQDFKDFTEADPIEPEDSKKVKGFESSVISYGNQT